MLSRAKMEEVEEEKEGAGWRNYSVAIVKPPSHFHGFDAGSATVLNCGASGVETVKV